MTAPPIDPQELEERLAQMRVISDLEWGRIQSLIDSDASVDAVIEATRAAVEKVRAHAAKYLLAPCGARGIDADLHLPYS